jgi:excinuclease ABC subunit C
MEEVLSRRMGRYLEQVDLSPHDRKRDESFAALPGLVVIDGGKGQLAAGMRALRPFVERGVTVIGLAKRLEEVYLPGQPEPLRIPRSSEALFVLQHLRDEAHRFAITYHRAKRGKRALASPLDEVPGVGPARKKALLRRFGSLARLRAATEEEVAGTPGIGPELARTVVEHLHGAGTGAGTRASA